MAANNEEFYRCPECDNAYFIVEKHQLISNKSLDISEDSPPMTVKTIYKLKCAKCNKIYTQKELVSNE